MIFFYDIDQWYTLLDCLLDIQRTKVGERAY